MNQCKCGSYAINHHCHGRDGSDGDLCDVCYWRKRAEPLAADARDAAYGLKSWLQEIADSAGKMINGNMLAADAKRHLTAMQSQADAREIK